MNRHKPQPRLTAIDVDQETLDHDDYEAYGNISKRAFLDRAGKWVLGGLAAAAIPGALSPGDALAQLVAEAAPEIIAISHASAVVALDQATVFIDPVGPQEQYRRFGRPDIVVLTRAHPAHLSIDTMIGMLRRDTVVLAPQTVIDQLPLMISNNVVTPFEAGKTQQVDGITFTAFPASAPIPSGAAVHARDRGDIGVLMEADGARVYF